MGIPAVMITALTDVARSVGAGRILKGYAVTSVTGNPNLEEGAERAFRKKLVRQALQALTTKVEEQLVVR